ncbi:MAG: hypothetical protein LBT80_01635 [Lactobacillaceae bacterium]|jgi:hypothetical protein|nr:hypothetical protein [Lactobacillaceae bacterium]
MKNAELKQTLDKLLADNWVIHEQLLFQEKVIAWYEARTDERAPIHELCEEKL